MKTKKILSVALAILMLIGTFAVGASAASVDLENTDIILAGTVISGLEESYWLTVDGALTSDGASAENYNVAITPETEESATKITLKNAEFGCGDVIGNGNYCAILSASNLDVEVHGTNRLEAYPETEGFAYGIYMDKTLGIYGDGSLELNVGDEWATGTVGIRANKIDISGDVDIKLNVESIHEIAGFYFGEGVFLSDNVNLEINETFAQNSEAEFEPDPDDNTKGVDAMGFISENGGIALSGNAKATVNMINPDSVTNINRGAKIKDSIELSGKAQLTVNGTDGEGSCGFEIKYGGITVKDSASINVKAGNSDVGVSYGIYTYNGDNAAITVSDNAKITATAGNSVMDSVGIYAEVKLVATDNAYISASSGNSEKSEAYGVLISDGAALSGKAKLIGKAGSSTDVSYGVYTEEISVSDDAALEGYAGIGKQSCGINAYDITVYGNAKLTGESEGATDDGATVGIYATEFFKGYGNAEINAKSGNGYSSCGLGAEEMTVSGSAKINATSGDATNISTGIYADNETLIIADNATVKAKSGKGQGSYGINASEGDGMIISGNAVVEAEASRGVEHSMGIFAVGITAKDNANIKATASDSDIYSFGIVGVETTFSDAVTVEASGSVSALYAQAFNNYSGAYIAVSTDTNPENAVVYNGTDLLVSYEEESTIYDSAFKYVFIAAEAPAEPEPELNFFEQLIADIVSFFNSIIEFFSSFFSFLG